MRAKLSDRERDRENERALLLPRNESLNGVGTPVSVDYGLNECFD